MSRLARFTRFCAAGVLLLLMTAVFQTASGCHDDSTGCCMVCPSTTCACGDGCISCADKCMMGSGCACNSTLPPEAPAAAAPAGGPMSESPDAHP
jgi:hypothetical protein